MKPYYETKLGKLYHGDCLEIMPELKPVGLVFTSPPYAERRKTSYGGINENDYVDWFLPIGVEIKHILKSTGSFFLNIKPHTVKGERSLYVNDLVSGLKRIVNFKYIEEYCWTKQAFPGDFKGRMKNAFEPIYHFTKSLPSEIRFNPVACGTPMKQESIDRTYRKQCGSPKNGSRMTGMNTTNIRHLKLARPSNVINVNNISNQFSDKQLHPATFPEGLVEFFVKSFSNNSSIVLDLFIGSGTTAVVCEKFNRKWIGIEINEKYCEIAAKRIEAETSQQKLFA